MTQPVFDALFEGYDFTETTPSRKAHAAMLEVA